MMLTMCHNYLGYLLSVLAVGCLLSIQLIVFKWCKFSNYGNPWLQEPTCFHKIWILQSLLTLHLMARIKHKTWLNSRNSTQISSHIIWNEKNKIKAFGLRAVLTSSLHYSIVCATMEIENKESQPLGKFPYSFFATPSCGEGYLSCGERCGGRPARSQSSVSLRHSTRFLPTP